MKSYFPLVPLLLGTFLTLAASANSDITRGSSAVPDSSLKEDKEVVLNPEYSSYKDMHISRQIRRALVRDRSFSESARNIDIISSAGHVTLIGPVQSKKELNKILVIVRRVDGISTLTSELTVPQQEDSSLE